MYLKSITITALSFFVFVLTVGIVSAIEPSAELYQGVLIFSKIADANTVLVPGEMELFRFTECLLSFNEEAISVDQIIRFEIFTDLKVEGANAYLYDQNGQIISESFIDDFLMSFRFENQIQNEHCQTFYVKVDMSSAEMKIGNYLRLEMTTYRDSREQFKELGLPIIGNTYIKMW